MIIVEEFAGSALERGRAQGERHSAQVRESGILDFYRTYLERQLPDKTPPGARALLSLLHSRVSARYSDEALELVRGFCEGSGLPRDRMLSGLAMPDALNLLVGFGARLSSPASLGCTSLAAWGDYTSGGRLLYARSLDFPGNGHWDRFPLVARHRPAKGLRYVSIGSAGSVVDGITGVNEAGLTVALHQHVNRQVGWFGARPILDLGREALQTCRTLEEAVELCGRWRTFSGWTVVLTHAPSRSACAVERTHAHSKVVRFESGRMARTNTYSDPATAAGEVDYPCFRESSRLRAQRAGELLDEAHGRVEPATLVGILSDHFDLDRRRVRAFGQTIAQPHNMTSIVIDFEKGELWAAEGAAPVCDSAFRRIPLWDGPTAGETLKGTAALSEGQRDSYRSYLRCLDAWLGRKDVRAAYEATLDAVRRDPGEPVYRYLNGLFALKLGAVELAAESFDEGSAAPDFEHRRRAQRLWLARSRDLTGRRAEATRIYAGLAESSDSKPALRDAAKRGLSRRYERRELAVVMPDVIFADTYRY